MRFWKMSVAVFAACALAGTWTAQAGEGWRVVDTAGSVRFGGTGVMPVALSRDQELPSDAWIETADTGRAVLVRGYETIIVEPSSRVQLPSGEVNGNTQVLQTLGSAIYKVGKQQKPHFQVDTPYLAAVVKGTAFKITVDDSAASVEVTEGLVEVATPDQSDIEFVRPGFTALVSRENSNAIVVDPTPSNGESQTPGTQDGKSAKNSEPQSVVIPAPIGTVELDVKAASEGLALGDAKPVDAMIEASGGSTGVASVDSKEVPAHEVGGGSVDAIDGKGLDTAGDAGGNTTAVAEDPAPVSESPTPSTDLGYGNGNGIGAGLGIGNGNGTGVGTNNGVGNDPGFVPPGHTKHTI